MDGTGKQRDNSEERQTRKLSCISSSSHQNISLPFCLFTNYLKYTVQVWKAEKRLCNKFLQCCWGYGACDRHLCQNHQNQGQTQQAEWAQSKIYLKKKLVKERQGSKPGVSPKTGQQIQTGTGKSKKSKTRGRTAAMKTHTEHEDPAKNKWSTRT